MKRLYTMIVMAVTAFGTASAQWNTDATPVRIFSTEGKDIDEAASLKAVRTPDKKTWIAWKSWESKEKNGVKYTAVRTYLQLLDREGNPQFAEPLMVNDHMTNTWWSEYGLQVAADGSAIITLSDGRVEEETITADKTHPDTFTPAIYKIDQQGHFLWGLDGVEYRQYTNALWTNCYTIGDDTFFFFYNESETSEVDYSNPKVGVFMQRISDDGEPTWSEPKPSPYGMPQIVPTTNGEMLLFTKSGDGSVVYRLNRDLEDVWGAPVTYDDNTYDGYGMNAYKIVPDGKGGACVAFVRNMGGFTHNIRVQHINADGSLGFGLTGLDCANTVDNYYDYCNIAANPETEQILVDFESKLSEDSYNVMLQEFSYDGEYLFDELGLSIARKGFDETFSDYAYGSVGCGALKNGDWIVIYRDLLMYAHESFVIRRYNSKGERLWTKTIGRDIDMLRCAFFVEEEATYLIYREQRAENEPGIKIFRIGNDGSYNVSYDTGINDVKRETINNNREAINNNRSEVYDLQGRKVKGQWSMVNGQMRGVVGIVRSQDGSVRKLMK